jgi:vesicular inhibitory amino acid transporter
MGPLHLSAAVATVAVAPLLFIPSLRQLSHLSWLGFVSTLVVMFSVCAAAAADPHRTAAPLQPAPGHELLQWGIVPAFGIFAVSVSGHSSLPAIRASMARPHDFGRVLNVAFIAMAVIYSATAGFGYWYFGDRTSAIITRDLSLRAPFAGHSFLVQGLTVVRIVDIFVAVNAYTTYPLLVVVLQDMLMGVLPRRSKVAGGALLPLALRLAIFAAGSVLSFWAFDVLGIFMSLIGGFCSLSCSLLLPSLFFMCLYWQELSVARRTSILAVLVFGVCTLVLVVSSDIRTLRQHYRADAGMTQQ